MAWAPDGRSLYFTDRKGGAPKLFRIALDHGSVPELVPGLGEHISDISLAGTRLVYSYAFLDYNLWRSEIGPGGKLGAATPFQQSTRIETNPEYSPDGSQIAFVSDRSGENEVWVAAADGARPRQITQGASASLAAWSPGRHRDPLYRDSREGPRAVPRSGSGWPGQDGRPAGRLCGPVGGGRHGIYITWAPSGEQYTLLRISPSGDGKPTPITEIRGDAADYVESPEGRHMWLLEASSGPGLFKIPAAGGEPVTTVPLKGVRNYAPHRDGIYFVETGTTSLQLYRNADGTIVELATFDGPVPMISETGRRRFTVSPGGKAIVYAKEDQRVDDLMIVVDFR
ncbi:MAG: PD40 domain-containing protein [Acidobacteria bacterium]|nr:PD40 domain-containing protein [Acidobacteriota bacterium]MBI3469869.1 PD40 domain-containing protein [Candidatus Solibacter usitatus]